MLSRTLTIHEPRTGTAVAVIDEVRFPNPSGIGLTACVAQVNVGIIQLRDVAKVRLLEESRA
jgi:hypothetical protein